MCGRSKTNPMQTSRAVRSPHKTFSLACSVGETRFDAPAPILATRCCCKKFAPLPSSGESLLLTGSFAIAPIAALKASCWLSAASAPYCVSFAFWSSCICDVTSCCSEKLLSALSVADVKLPLLLLQASQLTTLSVYKTPCARIHAHR